MDKLSFRLLYQRPAEEGSQSLAEAHLWNFQREARLPEGQNAHLLLQSAECVLFPVPQRWELNSNRKVILGTLEDSFAVPFSS